LRGLNGNGVGGGRDRTGGDIFAPNQEIVGDGLEVVIFGERDDKPLVTGWKL
jgi:hypothetical protein